MDNFRSSPAFTTALVSNFMVDSIVHGLCCAVVHLICVSWLLAGEKSIGVETGSGEVQSPQSFSNNPTTVNDRPERRRRRRQPSFLSTEVIKLSRLCIYT